MNLEHFKTNTKTIDLSPIVQSIKELAVNNDINFNKLVEVNFKHTPKEYEIPTDSGKLITRGLLKHKEIGVALTKADENTRMENHVHEEVEIIKVLSGELHLKVDVEPLHILKEGEIILIPSHVVHDAFFPVESRILAITLPACDSWPESGDL